MASPDPYLILGVAPGASDEELRTAYRRLVQRHHPDHNNGSRESALRFAEVQEAYAHVKLLRKQATATASAPGAGDGPTAGTGTSTGADPDLDARLAAMEQELRAARERREKAARAAAQEAARVAAQQQAARRAAERSRAPSGEQQRTRAPSGDQQRTTDEELGYYTTDDSFTKIFDDFADQVAARFSEAHPPAQHGGSPRNPRKPRSVADWIDELGSRLTGEPPRKQDD